MKIVLDTNVMISGIFWGGNPFKILAHWMNDKVDVIASSSILNEYVRVIGGIGNKQPEFARKWIDLIAINIILIDIQISVPLSRDPDDNKFLECAVSGDADCVVSGDEDLLVLKTVHGIPILNPSSFLGKFF